jgi:hypothetical protein
MAAVGYVSAFTPIEFLWLNIVGAVTVYVVGILVSVLIPASTKSGASGA